MANTKITDYPEKTIVGTGDFIYLVDVSDTTDSTAGSSKKIQQKNLVAGANATITSLTGLTTPLTVAQGGIGVGTVTGVLIGNGTAAVTAVTAPSGTIVGTTDSQTLTNKTLTTPIISTISNTGILTLPTSTDTLVGKATTDVLTNKTLTTPIISSISNTGTVTFPTATDTLVARGTTDTLTNKRITKRAPVVTQSATPTINTDITDVAHITGLAQAITSMTTNLSGTPVEGDTLRIDVTDNGTARAITWGASFESSGNVLLPTTTVLSTRLDTGFIWNSVTSKWRCVATA